MRSSFILHYAGLQQTGEQDGPQGFHALGQCLSHQAARLRRHEVRRRQGAEQILLGVCPGRGRAQSQAELPQTDRIVGSIQAQSDKLAGEKLQSLGF